MRKSEQSDAHMTLSGLYMMDSRNPGWDPTFKIISPKLYKLHCNAPQFAKRPIAMLIIRKFERIDTKHYMYGITLMAIANQMNKYCRENGVDEDG